MGKIKLLYRNYISIIFCILLAGCIIYDKPAISKKNTIYKIACEKVNVRKEPNINSQIIIQLNTYDAIEIIRENPKYEIISKNNGKWVYVKTYRYDKNCKDKCEGWIFDYYIAYKDKFQKIKQWKFKDFQGCAGDYCPKLKFEYDGSYTMDLVSSIDANNSNDEKKSVCNKEGGTYVSNNICQYKGHLYQFLDLILLKNDDNRGFDSYLIFNKNGYLCLPESNSPCIK